MTVETNPQSIEKRLHAMLSDLLLLEPERVKPESLLVDELGVDSLAFIELAFAIEEQFGLEFPDVKTDGELLTLSVPEGLRRIEAMPGKTTLFEYIKEATIRQQLSELTLGEFAEEDMTARSGPLNETFVKLDSRRILGAEARNRLFEAVTIGGLARAVGGPVPGGLDAEASLADVPLVQLFRFSTVRIVAQYVEHLLASRQDQPG